MNYAELVQAIKGYMENEFPDTTHAIFTSTSQINSFIRNAEQKIFGLLQLPALRSNVRGEMTQGQQYLTLPQDFLLFSSVFITRQDGSRVALLQKDESYIREAFPDPAYQAQPRYIAVFGPEVRGPFPPLVRENVTSALIGPTPDYDYPVELHYMYIPASITDQSNHGGRTWLGENYDSLLLYGSLAEAAVFMQMDDDVAAKINAKFEEALSVVGSFNTSRARFSSYRGRTA